MPLRTLAQALPLMAQDTTCRHPRCQSSLHAEWQRLGHVLDGCSQSGERRVTRRPRGLRAHIPALGTSSPLGPGPAPGATGGVACGVTRSGWAAGAWGLAPSLRWLTMEEAAPCHGQAAQDRRPRRRTRTTASSIRQPSARAQPQGSPQAKPQMSTRGARDATGELPTQTLLED